MAATGMVRQRTPLPARTLAFWLAALTAAGLSLAAALVGLHSSNHQTTAQAAEQAALRNQRIAFFEARAGADALDFIALNILAGEYLQRGRETADVGDYERANYAATQSLSVMPTDNVEGLLALGSVKLVQHDFAGARVLGQQAIALKPLGQTGYGIVGDAEYYLGRYDEAATAYNKMVNLSSTLPSFSRLAALAFAHGNQTNAFDFWRQALNRPDGLPAENVAWAHSQQAIVYFALGNLGKAESELMQSLKVYPDYVAALAGLGQVRAAQGRWDEAIDFYSKAVSRQPQPQYVVALGDVYAAAGRNAEAQEQYDLVEVIDKLYRASGINTDAQLARFYLDHDVQLQRAFAMAEASYNEAPNVQGAGIYAWALYKQGRFDEAQAMSKESLRLGTPDAALEYYAAKIADALGNKKDARSHIERALALNPNFSLPLASDARQLQNDLRNAQ